MRCCGKMVGAHIGRPSGGPYMQLLPCMGRLCILEYGRGVTQWNQGLGFQV